MNEKVQSVGELVSAVLEDLEELFTPDVKITFLARNTCLETGHMLISKCSFDEIREALEELEADHEVALSARDSLCEDCPPVGWHNDDTRCLPCPRRAPTEPPSSQPEVKP